MSLKLSKTELLSILAERTKFTKKDCDIFLSNLSDSILDAIKEKKEVTLGTLGTFKYKFSKERICKVIKTGESVKVPAKGGITFKSSKKSKDDLSAII